MSMNIGEFLNHLQNNNCEHSPYQGGNRNGMSIKIINKSNGRIFHLQLYNNGIVTNATIIVCCTYIGISLPPGF